MIQAVAVSAGRRPLTARQALLLVLLLLFSAGLRIVHLNYPDEKVFDEFHYVGAAQVMAGVAENPGIAPDPYYHHPPLGKLIIAAGIRLFGDTPFGWRIFAVLFGLLSVGLLFQIAYKLFDSFLPAWVSAFIFSLDFLHIIHSRLAMLDIFLAAPVLAGMLSLLYLLERPRSRIWMAISAISWAIALAIKASTLIYLAAFLLIYVTLSREKPIERLGSAAMILLSAVLLFSLSSLYYLTNGYSFVDWLQMRWDATFNFTSRAPSHPYESAPPMWLFNAKAIWYHFDGAARTGILGFGNPALWLAFIPALFIVFSEYRVEKRGTDLFLLLWFVLSYLPFFFILWHRGGFLYYMLPAVAPMTLVVVRASAEMWGDRRPAIVYVYLAIVAATLMLFLPLVLGLPMPAQYQAVVAKTLYF